MRFFQSAVVALALVASLVGGVSAKKHHTKFNGVFSKTAPTPLEFEDMFTAFMKQYNKKYSVEEISSRFQIFKGHFEEYRIHNTEKNSSYTMGINEHSDLTFAEFKAKYFGYKARDNSFLRNKNLHKVPAGFQAADSLDWRSSNVVTPVKNQGQCGGCWAFSTTGSTEGAWAIKKGSLISLSEQQLIDCSSSEGNEGCNGGLMDDGFQYIINNGGICTEASYPYTAVTGTTCNACTNVVTISSFVDVQAGSETALLSALAIGPVSIAIEADQSGFQGYAGGVFTGACGTALDHGVLAVGYGTDSASSNDYWLVKNSWGSSWGEAGYIRLVRGQNQCGLLNQASYPVV